MDVQVGMSREELSKAKIERFIILMPTHYEQKRIVAKVNKLMELCEECGEWSNSKWMKDVYKYL